MSGITLEEAQKKLRMWLDVESCVSERKSYTIRDRTWTSHDLPDISKQIDYWNRWCTRLERSGGRGCGMTFQRGRYND